MFDLERELLDALNNPSDVWRSVYDNLSAPARTLLLTFTTLPAPVSLDTWQTAVAAYDKTSALDFTSSLKAIDDVFVSTSKKNGVIVATYRNPTMEEFCAEYLDSHIGVAVQIARKSAFTIQVNRIMDLSLQRRPGTARAIYPSLQRTFVSDAEFLTSHYIERFNKGSQEERSDSMRRLCTLVGRGATGTLLNRVRSTLSSTLTSYTFENSNMFPILDDPPVARGVKIVLGDGFDQWYERLWHSATVPTQYDSLANFERANDAVGSDSAWRAQFIAQSPTFSENASSMSEAESDRDYVQAVIEHLDISNLAEAEDLVNDYEATVDHFKGEEEDSADADRGDWLEDFGHPDPPARRSVRHGDPFAAMFAGLKERD